jgi:hypothetical protein
MTSIVTSNAMPITMISAGEPTSAIFPPITVCSLMELSQGKAFLCTGTNEYKMIQMRLLECEISATQPLPLPYVLVEQV